MEELLIFLKQHPFKFKKNYFFKNVLKHHVQGYNDEYGKHPFGYGFYSFEVVDGVSTWNCSNNCD